MKNVLKKYNLKVTPIRVKLLEILSSNHKPQTAEDLHRISKKQCDLATIYRNLEKFEAKSIIFKESINKKDFYYLAKSAHHHIICRECQKIKCVPCSHQKFNIEDFTEIKHQLLLTGICSRCHK